MINFKVELDNIVFLLSDAKYKKYAAIFEDENGNMKRVNFGDTRHGQYKDKIGYYSDKDHNDEKRLKAYKNRHSAIKNKNGELSYKVFGTPSYFSWNYL